MKSVLSFIFCLYLLAIYACSGSDSGATPGPTVTDPCGNALGSGNTIISGPLTAPGDPGTYDQAHDSLVVDPLDADVVYVGTKVNGALKSEDGGVTWQRLRQGLRHGPVEYPEFHEIHISPTDANVLYAATETGPNPPVSDEYEVVGGVYRSDDAGVNWYRINCGLSNVAATTIRTSSDSSDNVVLGVSAGDGPTAYYSGGIYWSDNGGETWQLASSLPAGSADSWFKIQDLAGADFLAFLTNPTGSNLGFYISSDYGQSWNPLLDPLSGHEITDFAASADGQTIYASARDAFTIDRTIDGGDNWSTLAIGADVIAISPDDPNRVIFAEDHALYLSTNGLTTYGNVLMETSNRRFQDIEFSPSDPDVVYAITDGWMESEGYYFYRSIDGGASFRLMARLRSDVINAIP